MNPRPAMVSAALLAAGFILCACWIPLPTETALLVEVLDEKGDPVGNVPVILDGGTFTTPDEGNRQGQVFRSFNGSGEHTVAIDIAGIYDVQGGNGLVARAAMVSGENVPLSAASRPFFLSSPLLVPVVKDNITKVTIYLADLYVSPKDNQWLTDGSDAPPAPPFRAGDGSREFAPQPLPTFAWREEPSLAGPVTGLVHFTFQLWEDPDGDIRYPLGVHDAAGYAGTVMQLAPDWEVPHSGLQRTRAPREDNGKVFLWASPAQDASTTVVYDVYYAQAAYWSTNDPQWEDKQVIRDASWSSDGGARYFEVGPGTANPVVLKAGVPYRFALRARDAAGNLDSSRPTATRVAVTDEGAHLAWNATAGNTWAMAETGGTITVQAALPSPSTGAVCRIYLAPEGAGSGDFLTRPFSERFRYETISTFGAPVSIGGLVNGLTYTVGIEPINAVGEMPAAGGTLRTVAVEVPSGKAAYVDTIAPVLPADPSVTVSQSGTGTVTLYFDAASDDSALGDYRVYVTPRDVPVSSDPEGYPHQDMPAGPGGAGRDSSVDVTGLVNGVPYQFYLAALDRAGNRILYNPPAVIEPADTVDVTRPLWDSADTSVFTSVAWSFAGDHRLLGWTYDYQGFPLRRSPRNAADPASGPGGEYVWRVVQESEDYAGQTLYGALAAFYAYSSYYFHSGSDSDNNAYLRMDHMSGSVRHSRVWPFLWRRLGILRSGNESAPAASVRVMNAYLGSVSFPNTTQYKQRNAADFLAAQRDYSRASSVNQMSIFYRTNPDGKAISLGPLGGPWQAYMDVVLTNRAVTNSQGAPYLASENRWDPPFLSSKKFVMTYNYNADASWSPGWTPDSLVVDPDFSATEGIYFDGQRLMPDLSLAGYPWQDPAW
jgi:hypothetical protein